MNSHNEHARHGPGHEHEWSRTSDATEPEHMGPNRRIMRLFVSIDVDDSPLIEIADTQVTSDAPGAKRLRGGNHHSISFSRGEAEWLLVVLRSALDRLTRDLERQKKQPA